jgi:sortase A
VTGPITATTEVHSAPDDKASGETPPERKPIPVGVLVALTSVVAFSVLAAFLAVYAVGLSALQEQRSQHQLYAQLRGLLSPSSELAPPVGGAIKPGTPVALLAAPAAGIHREVVVEGTSSGDLLAGPGHVRDTALPGQVGQSVLVGKSLTAGAPFRHVSRLKVGDAVTVTTGQGTFDFTVVDQRVAGDPIPGLANGAARLTLITSSGTGWLGALSPSHLVYVDADLATQAATAPGGRPVAVPADEQPGNDDPNVWPFLVLWLQVLLVVCVAVVWSWSRWGRRQTWLIGLPLVLAVLWAVADSAMRLLPNVV